MKRQRMILLTLLFSLGILLSACGTDVSPGNELAKKDLVAVENPGTLATEAIDDGFWVCLYPDADFQGFPDCYVDRGAGGETSGVFGDPQFEFNDTISSVEVKPGVTIILYKDANYQGESLTLTADSNYVGAAFNDTFSSIDIIVP